VKLLLAVVFKLLRGTARTLHFLLSYIDMLRVRNKTQTSMSRITIGSLAPEVD